MTPLGRYLPGMALALAALPLGCGESTHNPGQGATAGADAGGGGQGGLATAGGSSAGGAPGGRVVISGVLARTQGECVVKPSAESPIYPAGTLDRLLATSYTTALLLSNSYDERVVLHSLEVSVQDIKMNPLVEPFTATVTGFIDSDGVGAVLTTLLPSSIVADLPDGTVWVDAVVVGTTLSGKAFRSINLTHPIELCSGCLLTYPPEARATAAGDAYLCKTGADAAAAMLEGDLPCDLGIDVPVPCTLCSDQVEACHDPMLNPSAPP